MHLILYLNLQLNYTITEHLGIPCLEVIYVIINTYVLCIEKSSRIIDVRYSGVYAMTTLHMLIPLSL